MVHNRAKSVRVAVVGLANVGKTTFINKITGANLKTGNFSGSTTNIQEISVKIGERIITFFDLPGFTSILSCKNPLEEISIKFLKDSTNYDYILHIINSDFPYFSTILDKELKANLNKVVLTAINVSSVKEEDGGNLEKIEANVVFSSKSKDQCRVLIDCLLDLPHKALPIKKNLINSKNAKNNTSKITKMLDLALTSKVFGIPIFFAIMFAIFWSSFVFGKEVGDIFLGWFEFLIEIVKGFEFVNSFVKALFISVLNGVGIVASFMPTIVICLILLNFLEETGYITRVCFLLDKIFNKFNLGGKSLIPLIIGAGCSISAYIATRMISDKKERFLTMIIIGFIPCSAKLAVFMLFASALFGKGAPIAIFVIYLFGFVLGLVFAKILGSFYKDNFEQTKIELFNYRLPSIRDVARYGYTKTISYLKNVATYVVMFATILSFFTLFGFENGKFVLTIDNMEASLISSFGKFINPIFIPLDFDWKMVVSLISALIAKEVAISTLAVLYSVDVESLAGIIKNQIGLKHAITYLTFMFFYLPCLSATISFYKENRSKKVILFLISFTSILAYTFSFIVKNIINIFL